jgi:hypothetical protein
MKKKVAFLVVILQQLLIALMQTACRLRSTYASLQIHKNDKLAPLA